MCYFPSLFFLHQVRKGGPEGWGNSRPRVQAPSLPGCQGRNRAIRTPRRTPHMASLYRSGPAMNQDQVSHIMRSVKEFMGERSFTAR